MLARRSSIGNFFRASVLIPVGISLVITLGWIWGFNTSYFVRRDAYDYGQLAAEFRRGHGFSSLQIFPRHVPYLYEREILTKDHWPNLYRSPLVVVIAAFFNYFFDSLTFSLIFQSGFWYLASGALLFLLARLTTNLKVAITSCFIFMADPTIIRYSYSGMTETLGIFLTLALLYLAILPDSRPWKWLFMGVFTGSAYLARAQFFVFFPLVLVLPWLKPGKLARLQALLFVLLGLALPLAPWMVRNTSLTGDPLFSFTTSRNLVLDAVPENSDLEMQLHAPVQLSAVLSEYGQAILIKFAGNLWRNLFSPAYWVLSLGGLHPVLLLFFLASIIAWQRGYSEQHQILLWITISLLMATFLLVCLTVFSARYYLPFHPVIILLGIAWLFKLLDRLTLATTGQWVILVGMILIASLQFFHAVQMHKNSPPDQSDFDQEAYAQVLRTVPADALIATDISERTSFFTGRRTLRLPSDPAELLEIDQIYLQVDFVLISKGLNQGGTGDPAEPGYHETYTAYIPFVDSPEFLERFTLKRRLANGATLYQRVALKP